MTSTRFGRVITAMVTPFTEEGQVDYAMAEKLAAHFIDQGSDALVVCGTTGESPTLTWDEEYELFRAVQNAATGRAKVIAGTGSNSTSEAIAATQKAAKLNLDGSLQVVPYYNKPPQEGLYQHFKAIAEACPDIPLMLYNVPGRTSCNLLPETVIRLATVDNIVAIKEASGNLDQAAQIRCGVDSTFEIYSGDDSLTLPLMSVGAQGVVSVASHLVGPQMQAMIQAFLAGRTQEAIALHLKLFPLFRVLFCDTNPLPVKTALILQGWRLGSFRPPLCPLSPDRTKQLTQVLKDLSLL
ncbi:MULTISPECIES: 4-hydroxy-tetrahydrodipicolinate synthase [Cyanophyceae]|uniref:4-hydroxy-tetrahydrodipicolinate synthase n=1 Tax=Cyanophyceae TaxID=3028117 RepID=UPI00016DC9B2|nr:MULTISPECIES: 4-hydroxy-tetrahydrodipicolinate synthase [Cyanophyceae]ACA99271.1 dihydrodipicolinate synthase [Picosynechococcus sp. PCC 7002]SMH32992.1 4-hydroxy-tetrahydrodipicolinate synthase [Picosynechococcus sp. OG1]SMQ84340.1 4-hydroxy-tetrahydrodipicolinate synthase [Synechococcus sp. 7002]